MPDVPREPRTRLQDALSEVVQDSWPSGDNAMTMKRIAAIEASLARHGLTVREAAPQPDLAALRAADVAEWLDSMDGRLLDIFGLWALGKRDSQWVAERLTSEGHLRRLLSDANEPVCVRATAKGTTIDVDEWGRPLHVHIHPADANEPVAAGDTGEAGDRRGGSDGLG
jgi:hypothetical protein